ncbi:MAG TPA: sensor histidine kinase [Streptosporangiaceae bacterium]|nr:sensor histidine kinase [Streptosporangiaceae bacterium]
MSPAFPDSLRTWLRDHPAVRDGVLSLALLAVGLPQLFLQRLDPEMAQHYHRPDALNAAIVAAMVASLVLRRRAPMSVLAGMFVGEAALSALDYAPSAADVIAFLIAVYSVAAHRPLARSAIGGVAAVVAFTALIFSYPVNVNLVEYVTNMALLIGVWWLGRGLRLRRAYLAELEDRAQRLERLREGDARTARVEERARIARELHDVVAHHVSVMTVQAGAARRILDRDPESAREAMSTIEGLGRTALSEMRRIVGVLRTERDPVHAGRELAPQPGLHDIGGLIDRVRETGLMVQLWIEGEPRTLSPGVDLAVYRLVQEALTNTLKHAGPQARAWVRIHYAGQGVNVEIEDDGRGAAAGLPGNGDSAGHGLVGMRERVSLYGGELRIGPRSGGGFEVRARFPLDA